MGILAGALITAIIQSSSVTTGLAIIFAQQGIISLGKRNPHINGANIGTTTTALISIVNMDISAKKDSISTFFI
ncbi:MAG: hypothetical protein R2827_05510 [Bdellovibrionales bacterium]